MRPDIRHGDVMDVLRTLPDGSVHCVVTSPPYWGLREYGADGQLGLEPTVEEYVSRLVDVFREVRRVLRDDGTLWLNLGDSYCGYKGDNYLTNPATSNLQSKTAVPPARQSGTPQYSGLKPKDLVGVPWRVAFALQADGWWLRSDIIWSKPNPMPESVTDRPTRAHEYVFLLSKRARYFFDADAIREPHAESSLTRYQYPRFGANNKGHSGQYAIQGAEYSESEINSAGRNKRTVWEIPTQPTPVEHFATFPEALVKPCIQAGTSERGCCAECGAPWERVVETERPETRETVSAGPYGGHGKLGTKRWDEPIRSQTLGWRPTCSHVNGETVPCVVLDPFAGTGTTGVVAQRAGRHSILIDISEKYVKIMQERFKQGALL